MSTNRDHDGMHGTLAIGAALLVPALCCGLPLLIAGGALAGLGSVLGNPWVIGAAIALVVAVVVWRVRRHARATRSSASACCAPELPDGDRSSGPATDSPTRHQQQ